MGRRRRGKQLELEFPNGHGGVRTGAGRKPKGDKPMMPHRKCAPLVARHPLHVTVRLVEELPSLRRRREGRVIAKALAAGKERFGFRLVHFSIQSNHLHLIVEAENRESLARGMKGLQVRLARALNKLWGRKGRVFADRYHGHVLKTPLEVLHALVYVLHNAKKHRVRLAKPIDEYSSIRTLDGLVEDVEPATPIILAAVAKARTWLLRLGWRLRHGLLSIHDRPQLA